MIADTTFLSDLLKESRRGKPGPASDFLHANRQQPTRTTIISFAEIAVLFPNSSEAWHWLRRWEIHRLHDGIAQNAADIERELRASGNQLGENDNWIAAFAAYYREPVISHDAAFDHAPGVRRIFYRRS
jgi:predicted nucleic acid-binding protein